MALSEADQVAIFQAAQNYSVPVGLMLAIQQQESGGATNPDTLTNSKSSALGMFQILSGTASKPGYGVTPIDPAARTDPTASSNFAAQYLSALYKANGNSWSGAVNAYSGGSYSLDTLTQKYPGMMSMATMDASGTTVVPGGVTGTGNAQQNANTSWWQQFLPSNPISGATTAVTNAVSGAVSAAGEIFARAGLTILGITIICIALLAMLSQSKTVQVAARSLAE